MSDPARNYGGDRDPAGSIKRDAKGKTRTAAEAASDALDAASKSAETIKDDAKPTVAMLKDQASQAATEATSTISAVADEARTRLSAIVDQQKSAGADRVSGVADAAHAAADELQQTNPQLARFVGSAADQVEQFAGNIRGSDIGEIMSMMTRFGRRQPMVFFAGAIAAGFLLARFVKSDAPASSPPQRTPRRA